MNSVRVGVINWDCSLPAETYFGYYQTRTLSPKKYRTYTPYYADVLGENKIAYHYRTQEEIDRELSYAVNAGIDYFTYVFYPEEGSRNHISLTYRDCSHRVYELNYARRMHESSAWREKIGMAVIVAKHPFSERDVEELVELLRQPYYESMDGRPLVYLIGGIREEITGRIREVCAKKDVPDPYFVGMFDRTCPPDKDYTKIDALSAYSCLGIGVRTYAELCEEMLLQNRTRLSVGRAIVPHFTVGWDPSPRVDIPCPWTTYDKTDYAAYATESELMRGAEMLANWIQNEAKNAFVGQILTFAWNEFEEGGWICPTYDEQRNINTDRVRIFSKIVRYWKEAL